MTDTPLPLLHIGFHKTASSLLQQRLFDRAELGLRLLENDRRRIHDAFVLRGALEPVDPEMQAALRAEAAEAAASGLSLVVSHERLSGYPASGGFDQGMIAERLKAVFPEARVLILIREQRAMLYSMYLQTLSDGGVLGLKRFLAPPEPGLLRAPLFRFDFYDYDRVIARYQALFGAENVLVLPFEALRTAPDATARHLIAHAAGPERAAAYAAGGLSASVNRGRPLAFQALRRVMNMALRNQLSPNGLVSVPVTHVERAVRAVLPAAEILRPLDGLLKTRMQRRIAAACAGRYAASNAETARLTGLDLSAYGYEMPQV